MKVLWFYFVDLYSWTVYNITIQLNYIVILHNKDVLLMVKTKLSKHLPLTETTYYVLLSLLKPAHGYVMMQKVEELSQGAVRIAAGTMYGAIDNLLKNKLITSVPSEDKRRKTYVITDLGLEVLDLDKKRMQHMINITNQVLEDVNNHA